MVVSMICGARAWISVLEGPLRTLGTLAIRADRPSARLCGAAMAEAAPPTGPEMNDDVGRRDLPDNDARTDFVSLLLSSRMRLREAPEQACES